MHARVTMVEGSPDRVDAGIKSYEEGILPIVQAGSGYRGTMLLVNRSTGKGMGVSLWETEDDLRAIDQKVAEARKATIEEMGGSVPPVDEYEVAVSDFR